MYRLLFQRNQPKFESNKILFSWFSGKETESFSVNAIGLVVCILWFRKSGELNKNYTNIGSKIPKQQRQKLVYHFQFAMGSIDMCAFILTLFRHDIIWYVSYCKVFETRSATPMTEFIWSKLLYKSSGAVCSFAVFFVGNGNRRLGLCDWLRLLFLPSNWNVCSSRGKIVHFREGFLAILD